MKITAVIPVKKNSSRLPGKNIKPFGNENLLTRKIRQVKSSNIADRIIVSSDSEEMLQMARDMGVEAILRPEEFSNESKPFGEFLIYLTDIIQEGHMAYTCVTSPFLDETIMIKTKDTYIRALDEGYDSLITVYKFKHYLLDNNGPINFKMGLEHLNSEYLPPLDFFTNGILFAPIESIRKWHYNYGPKAYRFEVDQKVSIDIDTKYDYLAALAWIDE
ncbi:acylneuraminate cytidylyltransferase family protein [Campylobacter lari]|uniref:acylneuraminate cytidylyltransferase family protein n=1 Tax=Campylobacter lari TaxID=201 RepID=UPI00181B73F5|nr:acylneuraminate cytidylyltransferase family protein [Campylobacter lari]EAJ6141802.1 acylneuraminate cytidylyltransferase family protein [Campylobacter lari]EAJ6177781.1 acylneuraminate cytidylyltransferase family protein [Campylobacter lari]EJB6606620.1 acylneuraminate cytidylyltransferase family protein [Campylobacter lari]MCR2081006.1 acylneuraminate cytidylyltransferase family protein [Campylobacter lari subsp. concheus]